jgi:hypothetical protein
MAQLAAYMVAFLRYMLVTWRLAEPSMMSSSLVRLSVLSQVKSLKPGMEQLAVTLNGYGKLTLPHDEVRQPGNPTGGAAVATRSYGATTAAIAASSSSDDHGMDGHCIGQADRGGF